MEKIGSTRFVKTALRLALLFFVLAAVLAGWMIFRSSAPSGTPQVEALKLILQFLLITGLGGIIAGLLSHIREERAAEDDRRRKKEDKRFEDDCLNIAHFLGGGKRIPAGVSEAMAKTFKAYLKDLKDDKLSGKGQHTRLDAINAA